MTTKLSRETAIDLLSKKEVVLLSKNERASLLLAWWSLDETNEEFTLLPESLQEEISETELPANHIEDPKYDPLLIIGLKDRYRGVRNAYIEKRLRSMGLGDFQVAGKAEILRACPCCGYQTLDEYGQYEICPVCFWEDSGDSDPDQYSAPNRMTLREARRNFAQWHAVSLRAKKFVDPEGREKWDRSSI